jgi:hypothetical protein
VLHTGVPADTLNAADTVRAYKSLARVERAFRHMIQELFGQTLRGDLSAIASISAS